MPCCQHAAVGITCHPGIPAAGTDDEVSDILEFAPSRLPFQCDHLVRYAVSEDTGCVTQRPEDQVGIFFCCFHQSALHTVMYGRFLRANETAFPC